jgi:hypothetical protein
MRQQLCVAAALLLSACTPPSSMYDADFFTLLHPSAASCTSQGQQFDSNTQACFTPPDSALASSGVPSRTYADAPAANDEASDVPIEPNAMIKNDLRRNTKLLNELVSFVVENGYECGAISAVRAYVAARRFKLFCDHARYAYEIEAKGRHWIVTAN